MYQLESNEKMSLRFLPIFPFRYVTLDLIFRIGASRFGAVCFSCLFQLPNSFNTTVSVGLLQKLGNGVQSQAFRHGIWVSSQKPAVSLLVDCSPSSIFS